MRKNKLFTFKSCSKIKFRFLLVNVNYSHDYCVGYYQSPAQKNGLAHRQSVKLCIPLQLSLVCLFHLHI